MQLRALAVAAVLCAGWVAPVQAAGLTAAIGRTGESTTTYRLGVQSDFSSRWWQSSTGYLSGYWDAGYTYWKGDKRANNHSLSVSPMFVYTFHGDGNVKPYIEAGIGLAAFSRTRVEEQKLGSALQFEDRIGLGLRFGGQELGLRASHYSNAGLKSPNDGVESYTLHYRLSF